MYHTSRYAPQSQEPNPDAAGVEALFTDLVRDYVASQQQPGAIAAVAITAGAVAENAPKLQLASRTPAGHETNTLTSATVCDSIDVHNSCSGATLLEDKGRKVGYHSRRGLQPPTIGRGVDGQEPHVLANGSSRGSVGSFASTEDTYEVARQQRAARRGCAYVPPTLVAPPRMCLISKDFELIINH